MTLSARVRDQEYTVKREGEYPTPYGYPCVTAVVEFITYYYCVKCHSLY